MVFGEFAPLINFKPYLNLDCVLADLCREIRRTSVLDVSSSCTILRCYFFRDQPHGVPPFRGFQFLITPQPRSELRGYFRASLQDATIQKISQSTNLNLLDFNYVNKNRYRESKI